MQGFHIINLMNIKTQIYFHLVLITFIMRYCMHMHLCVGECATHHDLRTARMVKCVFMLFGVRSNMMVWMYEQLQQATENKLRIA